VSGRTGVLFERPREFFNRQVLRELKLRGRSSTSARPEARLEFNINELSGSGLVPSLLKGWLTPEFHAVNSRKTGLKSQIRRILESTCLTPIIRLPHHRAGARGARGSARRTESSREVTGDGTSSPCWPACGPPAISMEDVCPLPAPFQSRRTSTS
jgi:hypothetical protein